VARFRRRRARGPEQHQGHHYKQQAVTVPTVILCEAKNLDISSLPSFKDSSAQPAAIGSRMGQTGDSHAIPAFTSRRAGVVRSILIHPAPGRSPRPGSSPLG